MPEAKHAAGNTETHMYYNVDRAGKDMGGSSSGEGATVLVSDSDR